MHLRFVEIFCDVAQRRSFSKGAAAHNVSQSSASQAVNLLEKRLGTRLIDRSKRPLELTPAGQVYYEGCRELLERFRSIEDRVRRIQDRVAGTVRVAAIYSVGLMQMEQWEQRFAERYPEARLRVEYLHPDDVYRQVQGEEVDIGLVSFPRSNAEIDYLDWQSQPMVVVVSPAHRLAPRGEIGLSELDGEDFVGFTQELTIRKEIDKWLKRGRVSVQIVHEFDNIETIKRAIEIGSGVAILPRPTVWQEIASGRLVALTVADTPLVRPLGIVHKRHKQLTTAVEKFIELLQQDAGEAAPTAPLPDAVRDGVGSEAANGRPDSRRARGEGGSPRRRKKRAPVG